MNFVKIYSAIMIFKPGGFGPSYCCFMLTFDYIRLWAHHKSEKQRRGLHKAQGLMALLVTSPVIHDFSESAS